MGGCVRGGGVARVGSGIEAVNEPRLGADRGSHAERVVLGELERLEMIENDRLLEALPEFADHPRLEQDGVTAQVGGDTGDRVRRASQ